MTSGEFHSHILKIVKRCQFPCQQAEERAIRDAIFMGMNSQWARDKAINLMNEEGKEVTVEFLMNHLAVEDGNAQHKFLSQLNSNSSVNFAAYDHRQKTEGRATDQSAPVERMRYRINQECRLLYLPPNHLENPQEWKESV